MQATFYCENCGKPVPLDAEECPHCQSRFTAVQCPQCSFIGASRLFSAGCPQCGYLSTSFASPAPQATQRTAQPNAAAPARGEEAERPPAIRRYRKSSNRLPGWFYTLASVTLLVALIALIVIALNLK